MLRSVYNKTINKYKRTTKTTVKNNFAVFILLLIITVLSCVAGFFVVKNICKNDVFVLNGEKEIVLNLNDEYVESGAKLIEFGKDKSSEVAIIGEVNTSVAGTYQLQYVIKSGRFKDIKRVRTIIVK